MDMRPSFRYIYNTITSILISQSLPNLTRWKLPKLTTYSFPPFLSSNINYISHWLLTQTLLPSIQAAASISPPGTVRIVNVSSQAHHDAPSYGINLLDVNQNVGFITGPVKRYGASKLANILHARELYRRYGTLETRALHADPVSIPSEGEIWTASINPGRVDTCVN